MNSGLGDEDLKKRTKNPHELRKEKETVFLVVTTLVIIAISLLASISLSI
jgi:hypothetical protein